MNADLFGWILSAAGFAFAMSASPGPNNTMVAASGANFGLRLTVPHMAGILVGFFVLISAIGLGMGDIVVRYPSAQDVLKWGGAAYLLWLAFKIGTAQPVVAEARVDPGISASGERIQDAGGKPFTFLQASLFQWVNPKAWIVSVSAVATFAGEGAAIGIKTALLPIIFAVVTMPLLVIWTLTGVGAGRFLKTPRALRLFNYTIAGLLIVSLVPQFT